MAETSQSTSVVTNLPADRNRHFVGRRDLLENLERAFSSAAEGHNVQVISGMSGAGKTAAALEYAHTRQNLYDLIWFIRAETPASMGADITKLAARLSPGAPTTTDFQQASQAVRRALRLRSRWLLIFDDAQSAREITACIPWKNKGNVLITSRNADWKPLANANSVGPFSREDSVAFLQLHIPEMRDRIFAEKLALALGDLPMALEQAAAYIKLARIKPEDYLKAYEAQWAQLLQRGKPGADFPTASAMAWELSFKQLQINHPGAADLLTLCSFLGAEQIPFAMINNAWEQLPQTLAEQALDRAKFADSVALLQEFSLAQAWDKSIVVHCVTAVLTRNRLAPEDRAMWATAALSVVDVAFPFDSQDPTLWPKCAESLPHVLQATAHAQAAGIAPAKVADLLDKAGWFLLKQAQFTHARQVLESALKLVKEKIGPASTMAARVANNLGRARQRTGDWTGAMELFEDAMEIDSFRYGPSTPYMATAVNNFGMTLAATGQTERARERFEWALKIFTAHYGENHFKIASVLNNLGYVLAELKMPEEANSCYRRAMRIVEGAQGNHPNLACIALNLGCLLKTQGHIPEAGQLLERALKIDETRLGQNHPRVAHDLGKLAQFHDQGGQRRPAINCLERAEQIIESNYGPESPQIIPYLKELARIVRAEGDVKRATTLAGRVSSLHRDNQNNTQANEQSVGTDDEVLSQ